MTAYRVVQEALTNVRRHAGRVERVEVHIAVEADRLAITVCDDGRGAAADATEPGFGLLGMRERVAAVGGTVTAVPRTGGGWRVDATLPLTPASIIRSAATHDRDVTVDAMEGRQR